MLISVSEKAEKAEKSLSFAKTHALRFRVRRAMSSFRGAFVRNVRLDGDDAETRDSPSTVSSETAKLLERLVEIDDACFPSDAGELQARGAGRRRRGCGAPRDWSRRTMTKSSLTLTRVFFRHPRRVRSAPKTPRTLRDSRRSRRTPRLPCVSKSRRWPAPVAAARGHARRLVAAILNEARRRNVKRVALRVEIANRAAVALYESAGFVEDTSRKRAHEGYYGAGRHGTVYERLF